VSYTCLPLAPCLHRSGCSRTLSLFPVSFSFCMILLSFSVVSALFVLPLLCWPFHKIILFHFEALLHNNIFSKHPLYLYCAIYCTIYNIIIKYIPVIAPPPPNVEVFLRCFELWGDFFVFLGYNLGVGFWMGRAVRKKNCSRHGKGALLHIIVQYPPPSPLYFAYNIAQYIFPHDPLYYCNIGNIL